MLIRQWTTNDGHIVSMCADVNASAVHTKFPYDMQTLISQDAVTAASIEAAPAKGAFLQSLHLLGAL